MKRARFVAILFSASLAANCNSHSPTGPSRASADPPATLLVASGPIAAFGPNIEWNDFRTAGAGLFLAAPDLGSVVAPGAPSNLTSSVSGNTVIVQWAAPGPPDPPTSYVIEAGAASGATNIATFDTGRTATSLTVVSVPAGAYYVRSRARNSVGLRGPSNEAVISVGGAPGSCTTAPAAPLGLVAAVTGSTVSLSWSAAAGATSDVLEAGSSPARRTLQVQ
jgi:hypothetical protein